MVDSVLMAELSWPEYAARIKAGATVLLPAGATEQHGPHLPLGVDVYLPTAVCARVAAQIGGIVAPAIPYGYKSQPRSGGGEHFPGTTSLDAHTLSLVVRDVIRGLAFDGVKRIVVVVGHFENSWAVLEGIDLALRELRRDRIGDVSILKLAYWDLVRTETLERLFPGGYPGIDLEHASLLETSMMLLVRPDLVETEKIPGDGPGRFPAYERFPEPVGYLPPSGVLARADGASAEKGQWLMDDHVTLITEAIRDAFKLEARTGDMP